MTIRNLLIISAIIIFISGVGTVLAPELMFDMWGVTADPVGLIMTRLGGALEIGLGVILWFARNSGSNEARRAIVVGGFVTYSLLFILMLISQLSGVLNVYGWLNVALYLLLTLGFAYFLFGRKD
jgi:hypothetical protein